MGHDNIKQDASDRPESVSPHKVRCAISGKRTTIDELIRYMARLLEPMSMPFVIASATGRLVTCNRAYSRLTGYSQEELSRMDRSALTPPELREKVKGIESKLSAEKVPINYEKEYARKDGSRVPVELYVDFLCDEEGTQLYYYAFVTDLTERRRLEDLLARYDLIFNSVRDILFFTRADGRIIDMNEEATKAYGYTHGELLTMNIADLRTPGERQLARQQLEKCFLEGCIYETVHMRKDGSTFPVEVNSRGIALGGRGVLVGVIRDVTERRRAEEEIEEARDQAEMYVDLISHDINNINQAAIGYLELTLGLPGTSDEARQFITRSLGELKDSTELISTVSKLRKTTLDTMRLEPVDLGRMLAEVQSEYLPGIGKDITVNFSPAPGYTVMANELLKDVFLNLLWNAAKHSGMHVHIDISMDKLRVRGKEYYRVAIADNGPGIPDDLKKAIFGRYKRGKTKARGSGLGLYLVKTLVKSFNGSVHVEDRVPGDSTKGAKFVVQLPAAGT